MTAKSLKGSQFTLHTIKALAPILDPNAAEEPQPQCHREYSCRKKPQDKADHQKPESYPLKSDDIWDLAKSKNDTTIPGKEPCRKRIFGSEEPCRKRNFAKISK